MTIPSRPAPAPPGSRAQTAAAGANASLEQLRQQLHQQQLQQQQNGSGVQRLTIKLPPPPKGPNSGLQHQQQHQQQQHHWHSNSSSSSSSSSSTNNNSSSITRKFPQARYTPTTNWDDSPFEGAGLANGNFKKVPPPRPPPPKVQVNGRKPTTPPVQSTNILTNIFNRKKSTKASTTNGSGASRVYGVSSGIYGSTAAVASTATHISTNSAYTSSNGVSGAGGNCSSWDTWNSRNGSNWNANWKSSNTITNAAQDSQLISFDSPPSSPTFTQKSNSDCVSVDSFSSDSNFSSPNNGSVSQPESGFEDDFSGARSRPATTSPLDPWETLDAFGDATSAYSSSNASAIGTAPVRNYAAINSRILANNDNLLCNGKSLLPPTPSLAMPTIIKPKISQKPKAPKPPLLLNRQYHNNGSVPSDGGLSTPPSPPMPQCAPPPPPVGVSLLDVISGKVDAIHLGGSAAYSEEFSQPYGLALYDFYGAEEGDLNFKENEKIYLLEQVSDEWYRGRTRTGCEGIFPVNYIDIKVPLAAAVAAVTTTQAYITTSAAAATAATPTYQAHSGFNVGSNGSVAGSGTSYGMTQVRCLYNFPTEVEGDLPLKENDVVTILYRINEDWLYGEAHGRQGQFPANFLEYVPDNIPVS